MPAHKQAHAAGQHVTHARQMRAAWQGLFGSPRSSLTCSSKCGQTPAAHACRRSGRCSGSLRAALRASNLLISLLRSCAPAG